MSEVGKTGLIFHHSSQILLTSAASAAAETTATRGTTGTGGTETRRTFDIIRFTRILQGTGTITGTTGFCGGGAAAIGTRGSIARITT
jgi:hypothetical protein